MPKYSNAVYRRRLARYRRGGFSLRKLIRKAKDKAKQVIRDKNLLDKAKQFALDQARKHKIGSQLAKKIPKVGDLLSKEIAKRGYGRRRRRRRGGNIYRRGPRLVLL